jgi:hypothetical protein
MCGLTSCQVLHTCLPGHTQIHKDACLDIHTDVHTIHAYTSRYTRTCRHRDIRQQDSHKDKGKMSRRPSANFGCLYDYSA